MAQDITDQLLNAQQMEVAVAGPDDANRLFICSGEAVVLTGGDLPQQLNTTFTFLVGPALGRRQFVRATATAGLTGVMLNFSEFAAGSLQCGVSSVDADFDDEAGRVQVRVEIDGRSTEKVLLVPRNINYQVMILAEMVGA